MEYNEDILLELQTMNTHIETLIEVTEEYRDSVNDIKVDFGFCVSMLALLALLGLRNIFLSWTKKGVKDV